MRSQHVEPLIPALWCPVPSAIHPAWRVIQVRNAQWVARMRLVPTGVRREQLAGLNVGELAARFAPRGTLDGVQLIADLLTMTFTLDDLHDQGILTRHPDELAHLFTRLHRPLIDASTQADDPLPDVHVQALRDLRDRLGQIASPALVSRMVSAIRDTLLADVQETAQITRGCPPDLDDYVQYRIASSWVLPIATVVAAADGFEPTSAQLDQPAVAALTDMAALLMGWDNDIYGYAKDHRAKTADVNNLPDVLARTSGLAAEQALRHAVALRDRLLAHFLRVRARTESTADPQLRSYLANLASMIRGQLDWAATCPRFFQTSASTSWPVRIAADPSDTSAEPLPIASIAHWWQPPVAR